MRAFFIYFFYVKNLKWCMLKNKTVAGWNSSVMLRIITVLSLAPVKSGLEKWKKKKLCTLRLEIFIYFNAAKLSFSGMYKFIFLIKPSKKNKNQEMIYRKNKIAHINVCVWGIDTKHDNKTPCLFIIHTQYYITYTIELNVREYVCVCNIFIVCYTY